MKLLLLCLFLLCPLAYGLAPIKAANKKLGIYMKEGVVIGGEAGVQFTLKDAFHYHSKKQKMERVSLVLGDALSQPLKNKVAYFLSNKDKDKLGLTIYQMGKSSVSQQQLRNLFMKSPYVKNVSFWFDPFMASTSLQLDFKQPVEVEVFERVSANGPSRIILDIKGQ